MFYFSFFKALIQLPPTHPLPAPTQLKQTGQFMKAALLHCSVCLMMSAAWHLLCVEHYTYRNHFERKPLLH